MKADEATDTSDPCDWVELHGDFLFCIAVGQVRNASVAEDLVQETFLAAIKARDRFNGTCMTRTWLAGILRHKICDHFRRSSRERIVTPMAIDDADSGEWEDTLLWLHEAADECVSPSRRMELSEFREALGIALKKLPERAAQVFLLYEVEQQGNREVCNRMKISEGNLWVLLHRARKLLRDELASWRDGKREDTRAKTVN